MSDARLSMNPEKRAKFDAMAREMVQGSIIEDAVTRFVSQVIAECAAAQAAEIERLRAERDALREAVALVAALPVSGDPADDVPVFGLDGVYITHGDVRRARAALRETGALR